jgi:hypothetical protein
MDVDRRRVLQSIVGETLTALGMEADGASRSVAFADVSRALTGYPVAAADAAHVLAAFGPRRAALTGLAGVVNETKPADLDAALHAQGLDDIANDLVAAWYSGIVTRGGTRQVVLYDHACMWSAMSFTKPIGRCGGATNYWSDPPA